ncbi:MAG: hypothetical protein HYR55_20415 [Acidobacteria bacterium]|nr:hypothetical protein [Acidobacteriota bacterium]MBI3657684.1 hypothetical protein [Acidobacteriota bacterium]
MERILTHRGKHGLKRATWIILAVAIMGFVYGQEILLAATYTSTWTAYAMGNLYGGGGFIEQGVFANHYPPRCPGDPSSYWPFGTYIQNLDYYVVLVDQYGGAYWADTFELRDVGDFSCIMPNYWVDVYFGRYRLPGDPCSCPGVSGSICDIGEDNSCTDAIYFGSNPNTSYSGPD